tara:strand:- start:1230 stop:1523 length:294 start_codon:yes stop_codon:yes gene_type:complete
MKERWLKRRQLQDLLLTELGCGIQHTGWPCNTCFHSLDLGPQVSDDQIHEFWLATLVLRGDYKNIVRMKDGVMVEEEMPPAVLSENIDRLIEGLKGD